MTKAFLTALIGLILPSLTMAGGVCFRTALNQNTFCQARDICERVASDSCFTKAYQGNSLERSASMCRGVLSNSCFNKAYETQTLENSVRICAGVSSDDCFNMAYGRYYNLEDSAKACRDFVTTPPPPIVDDPCVKNPR